MSDSPTPPPDLDGDSQTACHHPRALVKLLRCPHVACAAPQTWPSTSIDTSSLTRVANTLQNSSVGAASVGAGSVSLGGRGRVESAVCTHCGGPITLCCLCQRQLVIGRTSGEQRTGDRGLVTEKETEAVIAPFVACSHCGWLHAVDSSLSSSLMIHSRVFGAEVGSGEDCGPPVAATGPSPEDCGPPVAEIGSSLSDRVAPRVSNRRKRTASALLAGGTCTDQRTGDDLWVDEASPPAPPRKRVATRVEGRRDHQTAVITRSTRLLPLANRLTPFSIDDAKTLQVLHAHAAAPADKLPRVLEDAFVGQLFALIDAVAEESAIAAVAWLVSIQTCSDDLVPLYVARQRNAERMLLAPACHAVLPVLAAINECLAPLLLSAARATAAPSLAVTRHVPILARLPAADTPQPLRTPPALWLRLDLWKRYYATVAGALLLAPRPS